MYNIFNQQMFHIQKYKKDTKIIKQKKKKLKNWQKYEQATQQNGESRAHKDENMFNLTSHQEHSSKIIIWYHFTSMTLTKTKISEKC